MAHGHLASIRYIAEVPADDNPMISPYTSKSIDPRPYFTWVDRLCPLDQCPPAFHHPLSLLLRARAGTMDAAPSIGDNGEEGEPIDASSPLPTSLARDCPIGAWSALTPGSGLLLMDLLALAQDSEAMLGRETGACVVVEERSEGTFWAMDSGGTDGTRPPLKDRAGDGSWGVGCGEGEAGRVERARGKCVGCLIKADQSWLVLEHGFVTHHSAEGERVYDAEAVSNIRIPIRSTGETR